LGNGVVWKPSDTAIVSNYLIYKISVRPVFPKVLLILYPPMDLSLETLLLHIQNWLRSISLDPSQHSNGFGKPLEIICRNILAFLN